MTNTKGVRRGTRYLFSRKFKKNGVEPLSTFLRVFKVGDFVDIKGNGAFQRGLPHKAFHGRTGRVFNVSKHALGVTVNKRVKGRIIPKKINIRVEHVMPSKCRQDFLQRKEENEKKKAEARKNGKTISCKRQPLQPRTAHVVRAKDNAPELVEPIPYEFIA